MGWVPVDSLFSRRFELFDILMVDQDALMGTLNRGKQEIQGSSESKELIGLDNATITIQSLYW
jgi:hypothetical protein